MRDSFESLGKRGLRVFPGPTATAETPAHLLDDPLTSAARLFVRNNGEWPPLAPGEADEWPVTLYGLVQNPLALTVAELKQRFEIVTIAAVLECAGNGRGFLDPPVPGVQWSLGAVGCARFTGVRLADVLALAAPRRAPSIRPITARTARGTAISPSRAGCRSGRRRPPRPSSPSP